MGKYLNMNHPTFNTNTTTIAADAATDAIATSVRKTRTRYILYTYLTVGHFSIFCSFLAYMHTNFPGAKPKKKKTIFQHTETESYILHFKR